MNLYVGTSGYSYKPWKGKFYPKDLADKQMLRYYGEQLGTVEINNTFMRMPEVSVVQNWANSVPARFKFVLKAPKLITHNKKLLNTDELMTRFVSAAKELKEREGALLFQLPPTFKKDAERLKTFLASIPKDIRAAFEFRNATWFDNEIFDLLRQHGAAMCVADIDDELEVPFVATADWGYLRLRRLDYCDAELRDWLKRIRDQGWKDTFVFFKHEDEANGPRLAKRLLELAAET